MKFEKNIPSIPAKILTNVCFWACVAIAFPLFKYFGNAVSAKESFILAYQDFLSVAEYFDKKLFIGIILGGAVLLILTKLSQLFLAKIKPNSERDMMNYVIDELFSQLIGVGSIITVANIMVFFLKDKISNPEEVNSITDSGGLGLTLWILAVAMIWLNSKNQKVTKSEEKKDGTTENKHV